MTGDELAPAEAVVVRNQSVRNFLAQYLEAKTREWEAAQRAWEEKTAGQG